MRKITGVYIIEFDKGIKIGMSNNCVERLKSYELPWVRDIKQAEFVNCQFPLLVENRVKQELRSYIVSQKSSEFLTNLKFETVKKCVNKHVFASPKFIDINKQNRKAQWRIFVKIQNIINRSWS